MISRCIIPAAGFGTRFLPATKAIPKEMLPIVDTPVIQHVVEEAVASGITDIILVTNSLKRSIEDHFDIPSRELIENLTMGGKTQMQTLVESIGQMANFTYIRQK